MLLRHTLARYALFGLIVVGLSGPAFASDRKTNNTLLGAGLGAAAGAVLSEGDPILILGGAAAGGLLGNVLTENKKHYNHSHRHHYKGPKHRYRSRHTPYHANSHYSHKHKKHKKHRKYHKHYR